MTPIKRLQKHPLFSLLLGLIIIGYGLYDIWEELFDPSHVHLMLFIGLMIVVNSVQHLMHGYDLVKKAMSRKRSTPRKLQLIMEQTWFSIILGLSVIANSTYGLITDIEKIHSKSVSMSVGLLFVAIPVISIRSNVSRVKASIKK